MKKKWLAMCGMAAACVPAPAYAMSVDLSLFSGDISLLDALLLIALGLVVLGLVFIGIAFLKPEKEPKKKKKEQEMWPEERENSLFDLMPAQEAPVEEVPEEVAALEEEVADEEAMEEPEAEMDEEPAEEIPEEPLEEMIEEPAEEPVGEVQEEVVEEPAEEKNYPTLTITGINNSEFKIIPLSKPIVLGRKPECDLIFSSITISGTHCQITPEEDGIYIQDLNSTNGTYLNGTRVMEKLPIHKGDVLVMGQEEFKISL